jgi:hypothetical protein
MASPGVIVQEALHGRKLLPVQRERLDSLVSPMANDDD